MRVSLSLLTKIYTKAFLKALTRRKKLEQMNLMINLGLKLNHGWVLSW